MRLSEYNAGVIIDCHTHIVPPEIKNRCHSLAAEDPCFRGLYADPKARCATAEDLIESMDIDGIDISVAANFGWGSAELCRETNDYIMDAVSRFPDRIVGFGTVQPRSADAVSEVKRCAAGGLRGIGEMMPHLQGFDLADCELMAPIVEVLLENDMIFMTHASEPVGHIYPGKGDVTPDVLYHFITNFPELKIVCAHWGGGLPFYALMPEVGRALQNVWFDTAASPFLYKYDIFPQVAEIIPPQKILFGSDFPLITQKRIITGLEGLDISPELAGSFLGENARCLLNL